MSAGVVVTKRDIPAGCTIVYDPKSNFLVVYQPDSRLMVCEFPFVSETKTVPLEVAKVIKAMKM